MPSFLNIKTKPSYKNEKETSMMKVSGSALLGTLIILGAMRIGEAMECPPPGPLDHTVMHPHPENCNLFYMCSNGVPMLRECPSALHFNPVLNVCDWPWDAGCTASAPTTTPEASTEPENEVCPAIDGDFATILPHESDCTKFYICAHGTPISHSCPPPLHFNNHIKVCDWPESAGCEETEVTDPDSDTTTPSTTTAGPGTGSGSCPPIDLEGTNATLLPHETDCTLFYICSHGTPVQHSCPSPLHFNNVLKVCDWPHAAGCDSSASPTPTTTTAQPEVSSTTLSTTTAGPGTGSGSCPPIDLEGTNATLLPHETDCTLFYICSHGTPVQHSCPPPLHFNNVLKVCDWPHAAGCDSSASPTPTTTTAQPEVSSTTLSTTTAGPGTGSGSCPPIDLEGTNATLLPHETDCTLFYICSHGTPVQHSCPPPLHFNNVLKVCDWPHAAGCDSSASPTPTTTTAQPEVSSTTLSTTTASPGTGSGSCPPIDLEGTNATLLPHETDCTLFYICSHGTPVQHSCPPPLHFNNVLKVCDWPHAAGCDSSASPTPTTTTAQPEVSSTTLSTTTAGPGTGSGSCPPIDLEGTNATLLPHETDCTLFYICSHGTPVQHSCPSPLHFNNVLKVCDWPHAAGCDSSASPTPTTTTAQPEVSSTTLSTTTAGPGTGSGSCPPIDLEGTNATLLPHETDCTLFYICSHGTPVQHSCPPPLHFNNVLKVCDWPHAAGCDSSASPTPTTTTAQPEVSSTTLSTTTAGPGTGSGSCPPIDLEGTNATLLPHETDCTLFYICSHGTPVQHSCPPPLHFNNVLKVCDWPHAAGCDSSASPTPTTTTAQPEVSSTTLSTTTASPGTGSGSCPPIDLEGTNATLLPHETDCTLFYICSHGTPVQHSCPPPLHFNNVLKVCDWPHAAGCDSSASPTPTTTTAQPEVSSTTLSTTTAGPGTGSGSCPPIDLEGTNATLLPHETDCTLFYICSHGTPVQHACPPPLHFNNVLKVCDWPQDAGCVSTETTPTVTTTEDGTTDDCVTDDGGNETTTEDGVTDDGGSETTTEDGVTDDGGSETTTEDGVTDDGGNETTTEDSGNGQTTTEAPLPQPGTCPPIDLEGTNATLLPHENDCTKFYICSHGTPVLQSCPYPLHFNNILKVCDWPQDAKCSTITTTEEPEIDPCSSCYPRQYYRCQGDTLLTYSCKQGQTYNPRTESCEYILF